MQRGLYILFFVLAFLEVGAIRAQDSEQLLSTKGSELFDNEDFVSATPIYLQLLALQPRSPEYNYKYGSCLLYNSSDRRSAIKYLEFATANHNVDIAAFYFMGKAFHLNYQFEKAISFYQEYKLKSKNKVNKYWEVDRQIQACKDGKMLLKNISEIVVFEKKAALKSSFYSAYELSGVSGNLVISEIDQSKTDKKKGHKPLIYFPSNAKRVFFGSYGNSEQTGKDIYVKERNPDGSWSKPVLVQGAVNSEYDEDFAYMDEKNGYLYFSSKGHNSMGGYDIFKSKYDPTTNSFEKPENLDFAISSTDDDLLYIPDDSNEFAWFASSRQSKDGKIDVYKVKVERVSAPIAAVQGTFNSLIHPENKKLSIEVKDLSSNKDIGVFYTDDFGSYIIHFPKSGPYEFSIRIFGTPEPFTKIIEIPTNAEMYLFKQQLIHFEKTGKEYVDLINTESEDLYSDAVILAEIMQSKSELNPNADLFDSQNKNNPFDVEATLEQLNMRNMSAFEVLAKTQELIDRQKNERSKNEDLQQKSFQLIASNNTQIKNLQLQVKEAVAKTHGAIAETEKKILLKQATVGIERVNQLDKENKQLLDFADSIQKALENLIVSDQNLKTFESKLKKAQILDDAAIFQELKENISLIKDLQRQALPTDLIQTEIASLMDIQQKNKERLKNYESNAATLKDEIRNLEQKKAQSRLKKQQEFQVEIDAKINDLELIESEIQAIEEKDGKTEHELKSKLGQLEFIQQIDKLARPREKKNWTQVSMETKASDTPNFRTLKAYVTQQLEIIDSNEANDNFKKNRISELNPKDSKSSSRVKEEPLENQQNWIEKEVNEPMTMEIYQAEISKIKTNDQLSSEQKAEAILKTELNLKDSIEKWIAKTESQLKNDPIVHGTLKNKDSLVLEKVKNEKRIEKQTQALIEIEIARIDSEQLFSELVPSYSKAVQQLAESENENKFIEFIQLEEEVQKELNARLEKKQKAISLNLYDYSEKIPLLAEKKILKMFIEASEQRVETLKRENELVSKMLDTREEALVEPEAMKEVGEGYVAQVERFREVSLAGNPAVLTDEFNSETELNQQQQAILKYQEALDNQLVELEKTAKSNSSSALQEDVNWTLDELDRVENKLVQVSKKLKMLNEREFVSQELNNQIVEQNQAIELEEASSEHASIESMNEVPSLGIENDEIDSEESKRELERLNKENQVVISQLELNSTELEKAKLNDIKRDSERIAVQISKISKMKNEETKSEILAKLLQEQLITQEQIAEIEKQRRYNEVVLSPINDGDLKAHELETSSSLESKQRQYRVELEALNASVKQLNLEISDLSKRKAKNLVLERNQKEAWLILTMTTLQEIETELELRRSKSPEIVNSTAALKQEVTFEEEQKIAQSDDYKKIHSRQQEILNLNDRIKQIHHEMESKRKIIDAEISKTLVSKQALPQSEIEEQLIEINALSVSLDLLKNQRDTAQLSFKKHLTNAFNSEQIQNLLFRGVSPISISEKVEKSLVFTTFKILSREEKVARKTIVVNEVKPSGLVYRVQVGAFSKPINEHIFSEFTPVSGEKLNNGITRYMVGYFTNRETVMFALGKVRKIGYSDAFPVAYCDGERISMLEAKRMEDAKLCLPQGIDQVFFETEMQDGEADLVEKVDLNRTEILKKEIAPKYWIEETQAEKVRPKTGKEATSNEFDDNQLRSENEQRTAYNKVPGAASAHAVETRLGLFFTVQVGVYNKPVPASQLFNINPLITQRLDNGQIRYSTGIFHSIAKARPKKEEAIVLGISDAFITAYYHGKRISIQEALLLLQEKGDSILEPIALLESKTLTNDELNKVETEKMNEREKQIVKARKNLETSKLKVQLISKKQFDRFPIDVIKRYNQKGDFYYDENDQRVKSIIYNASNLPSIYSFKDDVDTLVVKTKTRQETAQEMILKMEFKETSLPGEVGDWIIRFGYLRELHVLEDRIQLTVFGITDPVDYEFLLVDLRSLGFVPILEIQD